MTLSLEPWIRPFPVGMGTTSARRRGFYLCVTEASGQRHCGEAAPLPGFSPESLEAVHLALAKVVRGGLPWWEDGIASLESIDGHLAPWDHLPSVRHALEQVCLSALASRRGASLAQLLGASGGEDVLSHGLAQGPESAFAAVQGGARALKVKVGRGPLPLDIARLVGIRHAVGGDVEIRVDANRGWTLGEARDALGQMARLGISLVEEPLRSGDFGDLAALRGETTIPIAIDERCRSLASLNEAIAKGAADAIVLKPMLIGGVLPALKMARRAQEADLKIMVTTTLDTEVALEAATALALAIPPSHRLVCGLDPKTSACPPSDAPSQDALAIPNPVLSAALARPHHLALTWGDGVHPPTTWGTLAQEARRVGCALGSLGVGPGDRIALLGEPSPQWVAAFHGVGMAGAVVAPVASNAPPEAIKAALGAINPLMVLRAPGTTAVQGPWLNVSSAELEALGGNRSEGERFWALEEGRVLILSSGTTGPQKPTVLTTAQWVFGALGSAGRLGHLPGDVWLCPLPLYHVGGAAILMRSAFLAITCEIWPRFAAKAIAGRMDSGEVSLVSLVPRMLEAVLHERGDGPFPDALRVILLGGAATSGTLRERCRDMRAPVALTWGMSEAASQVATAFPGEIDADRVGPPLPVARVEAGPGGRLKVLGPLVPGGGMESGDRGAVVEGWVRVEGRMDNVIITGGVNVHPEPIEERLRSHPGIQEAVVVGIPSDDWGQAVTAVLTPEGPILPLKGELVEFLKETLPGPSIPKSFHWVTSFPRTSLGKISRRDVLKALGNEPQL